MEQFSMLDPCRTGELNIVRNGWINPSFILTDRINTYGKLSYKRSWRRTGNIETFSQSWTIEPQKLFKREILIKDSSTTQTITIIKTSPLRGLATLEFPDGQTLQFKRNSMFSKVQSWYSGQDGNILSIENRIWSTTQLFKVIPELSAPANNFNLALLTFIGVHLILLRRTHAAAAH